MKKLGLKSKLILALISFVVIILTVFGGYVKSVVQTPFSSSTGKEFEVKKGDTLYNVIDRLSLQGAVRNKLILKAYIKHAGFKVNIRPGLYMVYSGLSTTQFLYNLNNGIYDKNIIKVTIPEGYDLNQIAALLDEKGVIKKDEFLKSCLEYKLPSFIKDDGKRKFKLEGFLFPDTYQFKKGMKGNEVIDLMTTRFSQVIKDIQTKSGKQIEAGNIDNIVTMASIIEREAEQDDERKIISSVFYNRLNIKMKLQSCATVLYALGYHKDKLSIKDTEVKSIYNTYYVNGLPEGPICSPGRKSIEAALMPAETKYIYFVSENNGTHFFTDDYKKFEQEKKVTQGF
ncbi:MAG: endolytic transglycosylase MltG [Bacillota bacterium]|nr:endolytic transglycosylase MltG [Bacillota bacterium]